MEYNVTPVSDRAIDVSALELKFPVVFKLNDDWLVFVSYNPRWVLLAESARQRLDLSTIRIWGTDNQYAWSIGGELPLSSEDFDFKLSTGFLWSF